MIRAHGHPAVRPAGTQDHSPSAATTTAHTADCAAIVTSCPPAWQPASSSPIPMTRAPRGLISGFPGPRGVDQNWRRFDPLDRVDAVPASFDRSLSDERSHRFGKLDLRVPRRRTPPRPRRGRSAVTGARPQVSRRTGRHLGWVAGQMPDQDVRVDKGGQRRPARVALIRRITSSHATLRLAAGTRIVPARERNSGVLARTARLPSTRKTTSSPSSSPSASRTASDVNLAATSITNSLHVVRSKDS